MKKIKPYSFYCTVLIVCLILAAGCDRRGNNKDISDEKQQKTSIIDNNTKLQGNDKKINLDRSIAIRVEIDEIKNEKLKQVIEDK